MGSLLCMQLISFRVKPTDHSVRRADTFLVIADEYSCNCSLGTGQH